MRLPRPYIPLEIRVAIAKRQYWQQSGFDPSELKNFGETELKVLLQQLFGNAEVHLDHDPPLAVRKKIRDKNGVVIRYSPDANDPDFLVYRRAEDHKLKTNIRGEGAQYPDRVRIKKIRRIERPKPKRKYSWPKRRFSKCDSAKHK